MWSGSGGLSGERCDSAERPGGGSREQEGARCRTSRTTEQGKVHRVAKRTMNYQEDAESLGKRNITKEVLSDQEGVKQRGWHRVA